jgi:hypothetical protein
MSKIGQIVNHYLKPKNDKFLSQKCSQKAACLQFLKMSFFRIRSQKMDNKNDQNL